MEMNVAQSATRAYNCSNLPALDKTVKVTHYKVANLGMCGNFREYKNKQQSHVA